MGILLVYDVTDERSFNSKLLHHLRNCASLPTPPLPPNHDDHGQQLTQNHT